MSKFCWAMVTSSGFSGSMPGFGQRGEGRELVAAAPDADDLAAADRAKVVKPLSFQVSWRIPLRWKTWAMLTTSCPVSRVASRLPIQSVPNSASPDGDQLLRVDVRACRDNRHVQPFIFVVTERFRRIIAGELRLRHPLEHDAHRGQVLRARHRDQRQQQQSDDKQHDFTHTASSQ